MKYYFSEKGISRDDDEVKKECPVICLFKALSLVDMSVIKRNKDGDSVVEAILSEVGKVDSDDDIIMDGAFDKSLKKLKYLRMLKMHQREDIIGRWTRLRMDGKLLKADGVLYDSSEGGFELARMTRRLIDTNDMSGVSIGFRPKVWQTVNNEQRRYGWDIYDLELIEASIVDVPANDSAKVVEIKASLQKELDALGHRTSDADKFASFLKASPFLQVTQ